MSMKWEIEFKEPMEDDESDDAFQSDDEEDFLDYCQCASDPCLSDWLSLAS